MELLISLTVISVLFTASIPLITQFSPLKAGSDKNVIDCIQANNTSAWYNTSTGAGSVPDSATDPKCYTAVNDTKNERNNTFNNTLWFAENGTASEKTVAKQILRVACDEGGSKACEYFINKCWKDSADCNPSGYTDLRYYLVQAATSPNAGVLIHKQKLQKLLVRLMSNLLDEAKAACTNPENGITSNLGCYLTAPELYIKACNNGIKAACKVGFDNEYNRSCTETLTNYPQAPTGIYKLPYNTSGDTIAVECNMTSQARAAITGCNAARLNTELLANTETADCKVGYDNNYNKHCSDIITNWSSIVYGTYTVTWNGWDTPLTEDCGPTPEPEPTAETASLDKPVNATDGSWYIGDWYVGNQLYDYYMTRTDILDGSGNRLPLPYNDGTANSTCTDATSTDDGAYNSQKLKEWDEYYTANPTVGVTSDHKAAAACRATIHGKSDWFLPSISELTALVVWSPRNVVASTFWQIDPPNTGTSTRVGSQYYVGHTYTTKQNFNVAKYVRCMRKVPKADRICDGTETHLQLCKIDGQLVKRIIWPVFGTNKVYTQLRSLDSSFKWTTTTSFYTGAQSYDDGMSNTDILTNPANTYTAPAAQYCRAFGPNWYLPSIYELGVFAPHCNVSDEMDNTKWIDFNLIPLSNSDLWSSTEVSNWSGGVYYLKKDNGTYQGCGKTDTSRDIICFRRL